MKKAREKVKFIGGSMDGKVFDLPPGTKRYSTPTETYKITVMAGEVACAGSFYTGNWLVARLIGPLYTAAPQPRED